MINKKFIKKLKEAYDSHEIERRRIISGSNEILNGAKRAIFSIHRQDLDRAKELIVEAEKKLQEMDKQFGFDRLLEEGSYKASTEEYAEAKLFFMFVKGEKLGKIKEVPVDTHAYLGGLCDLTGEIVRKATTYVIDKQFDKVPACRQYIEEVMSFLIGQNLTSYLRTKFDQAKNSQRKIEDIMYNLALKG